MDLLSKSGKLSPEVLISANDFIESVKLLSAQEVSCAVGEEEKHALQIKEQILHQIALIIALLDASCVLEDRGAIEQIDQIRDEALTRLEEFAPEIQNVLDDESLIHREYFQSVLEKTMEMLGF